MSKQLELLRQPEPVKGLIQLPQHHLESEHSRTVTTLQLKQTEEPIEWRRLWQVLRNRWQMWAGVSGALVATTLLFTLIITPEYEATARIQVDPPGAEIFRGLDSSGSGAYDAEYLETQAENLKSHELALMVIRELKLDQNSNFAAPVLRLGIVGPLIRLLPRLAGMHSSPITTEATSTDIAGLTTAEAKALASFQKRLRIRRDTSSRLIDLTFRTSDPVLSAQIVNTLATCFIEQTMQGRHNAIMQSTEWLSRQLDDIRSRMERSQEKLQTFQSDAGITDIDSNRNTYTEQIGDLSHQKSLAQGERIQLESFLARVDKGKIDSLPQIQSSPIIQALKQKLAETRAELAQASAIYGRKHPNSQKLQNESDEVEAQIDLQERAILAQLETTYVAALARERAVDNEIKSIARQAGQISQYTTLKKDAESASDLYNALYAKVKEAGISASSASSNIRIVEHGRVLDRPTTPDLPKNLAIAGLLGLTAGVLLAFIHDRIDPNIYTPEDVQRWTGLSSIAILPLMTRTTSVGPQRVLSSPPQPPMFLKNYPNSMEAEAVRGLFTSIMFSQLNGPPQALLVASSLPNEGKTTVAINLALALAQSGSTCLVEADLRKPILAHAFSVGQGNGLSEYLSDSMPLESVLLRIADVHNLTLLQAGERDSQPDTSVAYPKFHTLLDALRRRYQFIVIDSPPILPYSDGRVLASLVDGVVFVGRAGLITRQAMVRSIGLLQELHSAPIVEIVLNAAAPTSNYGYYYNDYTRGA